ncbi:MAG TPA: helix-turn-helix transcriptional regulator [Candidatus Limnocylindria bacterium]|nr:helix-turn-helix transcriptional regulator [Candidatus Limnocylindria bacterium]
MSARPTGPADRSIRRLTPSERGLALLVADGLDDRAIARRVGISANAVRTWVRRIRWRLGLETRADLVAWVRARRAPDAPEGRLRRGKDAQSD